MHFHDDSVHDAGWETDFSLTVPASLRSGLYAAHLRCGDDEEFIPFVVRATPGQTGNRIAYLVPTASYMAYANEHMPTDAPLAQLLTDQVAVLRKNDVFSASTANTATPVTTCTATARAFATPRGCGPS